ncbi:MAG: hypothetical protein JWN90_314 [Parcubacteria group bacterium]|nr:hypothetical protein [Parcubacteria group bacterium]
MVNGKLPATSLLAILFFSISITFFAPALVYASVVQSQTDSSNAAATPHNGQYLAQTLVHASTDPFWGIMRIIIRFNPTDDNSLSVNDCKWADITFPTYGGNWNGTQNTIDWNGTWSNVTITADDATKTCTFTSTNGINPLVYLYSGTDYDMVFSSGSWTGQYMQVYGSATSTVAGDYSYASYNSGNPLSFSSDGTVSDAYYVLCTDATCTPPTNIIATTTADITSNQLWTSGSTHIISGNISIATSTTLTLQPGVVVKFDTATSSNLTVNGTLNANGVANTDSLGEIFFTSLKDDLIGGDTNGDASTTSAAPGDWGGIAVNAGATATLNHTILRYGGAGGSLINNSGGVINIATSTIAYSSNKGVDNSSGTTTITASDVGFNTYGLYLSAGSASITSSSTIHDNSSYAVFNNTTNVINADGNWWATSTGPFNVSGNPSGTGDQVSDYVDFTPWIVARHYVFYPNCHTGDLCGSVRNNHVFVDISSTTYNSQLDIATSTWGALGSVSFAKATSTANLKVVDVTNRPDYAWKGQWVPEVSQPDSLELNDYYLSGQSNNYVENTITHELGHALGLDHSYSGNILYPYQTSQTSLGAQDINDYYYLWP